MWVNIHTRGRRCYKDAFELVCLEVEEEESRGIDSDVGEASRHLVGWETKELPLEAFAVCAVVGLEDHAVGERILIVHARLWGGHRLFGGRGHKNWRN